MPVRAFVSDYQYGAGVAIAILLVPGDDYNSERQILHLLPGGAYTWDLLPAQYTGDPVTPTLTLDDNAARALLDALTRHYHGAEDTRALRRDYDAERARTSELIGTLSQIALQCASPPARA